MVVAPGEVTGGGHAESGRKRGARVTGAVGIVFRFGAEEETVEPLVGADRVDGGGAAGEYLVDIALVGDIEHELVCGRGENPVQGDAQLDDAEVRTEVAAGDGEAVDQGFTDLRGEGDEIRFVQTMQICRCADGAE